MVLDLGRVEPDFFLFLNKIVRTACQTQAGIDHSAPARRGGHVQNRSRRSPVGNSVRADNEPDRRQSNHEWTDDQAA